MTHLPLFGETNAIRIKLCKDNHGNMKFLTIVMVESRPLENLTYVSWLCYFERGR